MKQPPVRRGPLPPPRQDVCQWLMETPAAVKRTAKENVHDDDTTPPKNGAKDPSRLLAMAKMADQMPTRKARGMFCEMGCCGYLCLLVRSWAQLKCAAGSFGKRRVAS
eukprot:5071591-Pyramimonas_sp.AAC.1